MNILKKVYKINIQEPQKQKKNYKKLRAGGGVNHPRRGDLN